MINSMVLSEQDVKSCCLEVIRKFMHSFQPDVVLALSKGGIIPGTYISQFIGRPLLVLNKNFMNEFLYNMLDGFENILIVDEINNSGSSFTEVSQGLAYVNKRSSNKKTFKYASLVENKATSFPAHYKSITLHGDEVWVWFPWEEWWKPGQSEFLE